MGRMLRATPCNTPRALSWGGGSRTHCPQCRGLCGVRAPVLAQVAGGSIDPHEPAQCREEVERDGTPAIPRAPMALWIHPSLGRTRARLTSSKDEVCNGGTALLHHSAVHTGAGSGWDPPWPLKESLGRDQLLVPAPAGAAPQEEKQSPQHSMQISRQSADSQQASMMPQSMSQGRSQSAHSPELQQQQQMQESSEVQEPHVAQSSTMLQRVRNSQKRQERMQWTQQSAKEGTEREQRGREGDTASSTVDARLCKGGNPPSGINGRDGEEGLGSGQCSRVLPSTSMDTPRPQGRPALEDMR